MSEYEGSYEGEANRELILVGMTPEDICEAESIFCLTCKVVQRTCNHMR